jgi:hypothetical protein
VTARTNRTVRSFAGPPCHDPQDVARGRGDRDADGDQETERSGRRREHEAPGLRLDHADREALGVAGDDLIALLTSLKRSTLGSTLIVRCLPPGPVSVIVMDHRSILDERDQQTQRGGADEGQRSRGAWPWPFSTARIRSAN